MCPGTEVPVLELMASQEETARSNAQANGEVSRQSRAKGWTQSWGGCVGGSAASSRVTGYLQERVGLAARWARRSQMRWRGRRRSWLLIWKVGMLGPQDEPGCCTEQVGRGWPRLIRRPLST